MSRAVAALLFQALLKFLSADSSSCTTSRTAVLAPVAHAAFIVKGHLRLRHPCLRPLGCNHPLGFSLSVSLLGLLSLGEFRRLGDDGLPGHDIARATHWSA